jgi:GMP synthase-like glutamine amidotransferase
MGCRKKPTTSSEETITTMKLCILDNDTLDPEVAPAYGSYGAMLARLLRNAGAQWTMDLYDTTQGHYPASFDDYEAVLLTGSQADAFSDTPWVVDLRGHVSALLKAQKKLLGVCFGHQLIAVCLGANVGRAPQGWGTGRMTYTWHTPDLAQAQGRSEISLLASHQDQVLALPPGATLLASNEFCPVAAYTVGQHVFCVQPHPEFDVEYSAFLLNKRRDALGEALHTTSINSLTLGHDGLGMGRMMVAFVEGRKTCAISSACSERAAPKPAT